MVIMGFAASVRQTPEIIILYGMLSSGRRLYFDSRNLHRHVCPLDKSRLQFDKIY
jgi:hypothetical protein